MAVAVVVAAVALASGSWLGVTFVLTVGELEPKEKYEKNTCQLTMRKKRKTQRHVVKT